MIKLKKVGLRNIKTAIAVFLCVIISWALNFEYPFYAAIAAIISMQSSVVESFTVGRNRILGTIVGAFIGFLCALIQPGNAFLCAIGLIVVVYICDLFNWNKSVTIAGIVCMAIMLNLNGRSPMFYSINRIIDTLLGIIVAIFVNYFIFPPRIIGDIDKKNDLLKSCIKNCIREYVTNYAIINLDDINKKIQQLEEKLMLISKELMKGEIQENVIKKIYLDLENYKIIFSCFKLLSSYSGNTELDYNNAVKIEKEFEIKVNGGINNNNVIYNYIIKQILDRI
ncbi:MAG: hypothetical protein K0R54_1016 [Clostridiaceae bacterium]|jgi:uncharacterized membrane protein YgaE (UPF0421/DUF939 family)|nr:hypothetical protein [Clostridiaceae bacterium]